MRLQEDFVLIVNANLWTVKWQRFASFVLFLLVTEVTLPLLFVNFANRNFVRGAGGSRNLDIGFHYIDQRLP